MDGSKANYENSSDPYEGTPPETTPVGYYDGNQVPAGVDMANGYGLYDMMGNVWEWCNDWEDEDYYGVSPCHNPQGPSSSPQGYVLMRGGSWTSGDQGDASGRLRCAYRGEDVRDRPEQNTGFRLVLPKSPFDRNGDGAVDMVDFSAFQVAFTGSNP